MSDFGIDLGTANTVVYNVAHDVVFDEPSMLLRRPKGRGSTTIAIGRDAAELVGRVPAGFGATRPLNGGVITDLETARAYLRAVVRRAIPRVWHRRLGNVAIGVPTGATELERHALLEAADQAGIRQAVAIDEPIAGALGCGIDPLDRRAHMVVDVGGGTAEVTTFCFGRVLTSRSSRVAGDDMTIAICRHLREHYQLLVGEKTAEQVKIRIGTEAEQSIVVPGRDAGTGRARLATVPVAELNDVLDPILETIIQTLASCLDDLPPDAAGDVLSDGVVAFGGAALTRGFDLRLEKAIGFPVKMAENPLTCVAEGAARALRMPGVAAAYGWS